MSLAFGVPSGIKRLQPGLELSGSSKPERIPLEVQDALT